MTTARAALGILLVCALASACSGGDDEGDGTPGGAPDGGVGPGPDPDTEPDAGHDPPTEECAADCDGCCDGDSCLSGTSPNACGSAGGACAVCDPGFVCELGGCTVDRTSRWDVLVDSGDVFEDNAGGTPWDPSGGLPDPYVDLVTNDGIEELAGSSSARSDTLAPSWNQVVLADVTAAALVDSGISATVLDDDPVIDPSDSMGTCTIPIGDGDFTGDDLTFVCPFDEGAGARGWTLHIRLIRK